MKKITLLIIALLCLSFFSACSEKPKDTSLNNNADIVSSENDINSNQTISSSVITSSDIVNKVNVNTDLYGYPKITDYKETKDEDGKTFTFSYAHFAEYPNDSCGVIGLEDDKGIKALHTTFVFNNTGFDGSAALGFSLIPATTLYCPEKDIEEALSRIISAFQNGTTSDTKKSFIYDDYEYTLNINDSFLLVSVIRNNE